MADVASITSCERRTGLDAKEERIVRITSVLPRRNRAIGVAVLMVVALAGCGSGSSAEGEETTKLTVGVTPVGDFAPIYYAQQNGIFEKNGLDVTIDPKGASEVPPLVSNSYQAVSMSWTTYIQAVAQGVELQGLYPGISGAPDTQTGIYVMPESGITSPEQLEGKSLGVNQPKATLELNSRVALNDLGVDDSKVDFTVIPLSTLGDALVEGKVDSAYLLPPFSTLAAAKGATLLVDPYEDRLSGLPIAGYVMTKKFIEENPETVEAFVASMDEAVEALNQPGAYQEFIPTFTELSGDLAKSVPVFTFSTEVDEEKLQLQADLMAEEGFATKQISVADHLYHPAS